MNWQKLEFEAQVRHLEAVLSPRKSRLRPYLVLFALKNHILLTSGFLATNNPSVSWYVRQLARSGIRGNYWGVRRQLKFLTYRGVLREVKLTRPAIGGSKRQTRVQLSEFYFNESCFLPASQALKKIFRVGSLSQILGR